MKSLISALTLLILSSSGAWITPREASAQHVAVSFQLFYDELSPYGSWVNHPSHGYVWIPNGDPGFSPYSTAGHWVFSDDGWMWVSDYPWGWAPFHYGRWDYDGGYGGWLWVPDNEWGPAWVSWRRSPGYYGWAPLRPGISISLAFGGGYHERNEHWNFVRDRDLTRSDIGHHYVNRSEQTTIINNSTVIVNTRKDNRRNATYIAGPDRDDVQRVTQTKVRPVAVRDSDRPGQHLSNDEVQIYRPQVQKKSGNGPDPAPSRVMRLNDVKPAPEKNTESRKQEVAKGQPSESRDPSPSVRRGREQEPRAVNPPDKAPPQQQPRNVNPSNGRENEKQPHNVAPSRNDRKTRPSQPGTNQDKHEKRNRK
jgi:hypothetical protein